MCRSTRNPIQRHCSANPGGPSKMDARSFSLLFASAAMCAWSATTEVTFHKDVEPIVQQHCQECHRAGEIAPFALMSYNDARPWAKAIKEDIVTKKMPPWFADPKYGHFSDDRSLSKQEIDTLA